MIDWLRMFKQTNQVKFNDRVQGIFEDRDNIDIVTFEDRP